VRSASVNVCHGLAHDTSLGNGCRRKEVSRWVCDERL
jgi:hypothetical protein